MSIIESRERSHVFNDVFMDREAYQRGKYDGYHEASSEMAMIYHRQNRILAETLSSCIASISETEHINNPQFQHAMKLCEAWGTVFVLNNKDFSRYDKCKDCEIARRGHE